MNWTPESDEWKQYQPRQGMICNRAMVNRSEVGFGGKAGFYVWCRHLPMDRFDFWGDYSSRPVCSGVKIRNQHIQCLNTGRRYGLTDARTAGILQIRKAERHVETTPKTNVENRNPGLRAVWGNGNVPKAVLRCLGTAREGLGSFFVCWLSAGKLGRLTHEHSI